MQIIKTEFFTISFNKYLFSFKNNLVWLPIFTHIVNKMFKIKTHSFIHNKNRKKFSFDPFC